MPRLAVAATQACASAAFFAVGALLLSIGHGIESGRGGIDLYSSSSRWSTGGGGNSSWSSGGSSGGNSSWSGRNASSSDTAAYLNRRFSDESVHTRMAARLEASNVLILGHLFSSLGWVFSLPAVSALAHVLGGAESGASTVTYVFVAAAALTCTEFLSEAGTAQTANWMAEWPMLTGPSANDDGELTAAAAFEMMHMLTTSRTLWLYAADDLLVAIGLIYSAILTYSSKQVSSLHGHLGLGTAVLCVFDFVFEINRFQNWRWASNLVRVSTLVVYVVLLPLWLTSLGLILRRIAKDGGAYTATHAGETVGNRVDPTAAAAKSVDIEIAAK